VMPENINTKKAEGNASGPDIVNEIENSTRKLNGTIIDPLSEKSSDNDKSKDDTIGSNDLTIRRDNEINSLNLEIKYDETLPPNNPNDDTTADEPNFAPSNKNSENIVSDASGSFEPNILIKRQSKDYATTSIETNGQSPGQTHPTTSGDQIPSNVGTSTQKPLSGSLKLDKPKNEADQLNSISEQANITPSKTVKIDALYFLNKFNNLLNQYLGSSNSLVGSSENEFDLDEFRARVMSDKRFELNETWHDDYFIMSCPAKSFLERFSVNGEFF